MVLNLTKTDAVPGRVCTDGNTFIGFTCGPLTKCWSFSSTKTVTIVWDVWLNRLIGCSTVWTPMSVLPNSVAKFWSSYSALDCLILLELWGGKSIVVTWPLIVTFSIDAWVLLGQTVYPHLRGQWWPCQHCSEGCKYANPLPIQENATCYLELPFCSDCRRGGYNCRYVMMKLFAMLLVWFWSLYYMPKMLPLNLVVPVASSCRLGW